MRAQLNSKVHTNLHIFKALAQMPAVITPAATKAQRVGRPTAGPFS